MLSSPPIDSKAVELIDDDNESFANEAVDFNYIYTTKAVTATLDIFN